jgi:hypothetical protein
MLVKRELDAPPRNAPSWDDCWNGPDRGIISAWECGLERRKDDPELANRAGAGELVVLPWKGGIERAIKTRKKYGTLLYLAMWTGLRGEPLDINTDEEVTMICTRTKVPVTYTSNISKFKNAT